MTFATGCSEYCTAIVDVESENVRALVFKLPTPKLHNDLLPSGFVRRRVSYRITV